MSDWEIVDSNQQQQASQPQSDWDIVQPLPNSQQPQVSESLGSAAMKAPFRIGEDLYRGGMNALKSIPGYIQSAKTEVPGLMQTLQSHPGHALGQGVAGLAELGQNIFNSPHDLINYMTNRLNLVPQSVNQKVQMARMPDSEQDINATFGQPQYAGENLARGLGRNSLNIIGGGKIINELNPINMSAKSIASDVLNTEKQQVKAHNKMYNAVWDKADKTGFNSVPYEPNVLNPYRDVIAKSYPAKSTKTLDKFISNPTLENAQKAQSDLGNLRRSIEEKARTTPLLGAEKDLHDALSGAEQHIEGNMFKNAAGETNHGLKKQYDKVTNSYRENVVPYKYNPSIQAYKNKEMLAKELVNSLSKGEFAAKKGWSHPALQFRNMLLPTATGVGLLGGGSYLLNQMFGNQPQQEQ